MKLISIEEKIYNVSDKEYNKINKLDNNADYEGLNKFFDSIQEKYCNKGMISNMFISSH